MTRTPGTCRPCWPGQRRAETKDGLCIVVEMNKVCLELGWEGSVGLENYPASHRCCER